MPLPMFNFFHQTFSRMNTRLQPYLLVALCWAFCLTFFNVSAQSGGVFEGDLRLTTQTDIDAFDYQEVTGDLFIGNSPDAVCAFPINDLSPLAKLTKVGGYLWISGTQHLSSLDGLDHLTRIGNDLLINNNSKLENLKGLRGLCSVNGRVFIDSNPQLHTLEGLERLHTIGGNLEILNVTDLTSLKGLHNLKTVGSALSISNIGISDFRGLDRLVSIGGDLFAYNNERLISLKGIDSIRTIGGDLDISFNPILTNCCIIPSLEDVVEGSIIIRNNAPVCSSLKAIKENCDEPPVAEIDCSQGDIVLTTQAEVDAFACATVTNLKIDFNSGRESADPITNLDQLSALTEVGGNLALDFLFDNSKGIDLSGLNNLKRVEGDLSFDDTQPSFDGLQGLEYVGGNLTFYLIDDADDFSALTNLRYVGGELSIVTSRVESFQGLAQLTSIGGFDLNESTVFSFEGLTSLVQIRGDLRAEQEDSNIRNLEGLENVERITGSLTISGTNYPSFQGLNNLKQIGGDLITSETGIDLTGLESLQTVGGNLLLGGTDGPGIVNVEALSNLQTVGGNFTIASTSAENLSFLASLQRVGGYLEVVGNPNLSDCCIILTLEDAVEGVIAVRDNAAECSSLETVTKICSDESPTEVDCSQEEIILTKQTEVDAFDCTSVNTLVISLFDSDDSITDLTPLRSLARVSGNLTINMRNKTVPLDGFDNLQQIDNDFSVLNGPSLDFKSFKKLTKIGGSFQLSSVAVENFSGLEQLEEVGNFSVTDSELRSFAGLKSLQRINDGLILRNTALLKNFEGLDNLAYVKALIISSGPDFVDFKGLSSLKSADLISVRDATPKFSSFEGLVSLESIESLSLDRADVTDLRGLGNLRELGDLFLINATLQSLEGLSSTTRIGDITLRSVDIPNLQGLDKFERINGRLVLSRTTLQSLKGLENITSIGGLVSINDNAKLVNLDGLSSLTTVNSSFQVNDNDNLVSLEGLSGLRTIAGYLRIYENRSLTECCIIPSLVAAVQGEISIYNNAPECSSLEAIAENCDEEITEENARTAQDLHAFPNPSENFVQIRVDQPTSVQLFNTAGYLVKEQRVEQEDVMDLTTVKAGVYLLKAPGKEVQRIIKK